MVHACMHSCCQHWSHLHWMERMGHGEINDELDDNIHHITSLVTLLLQKWDYGLYPFLLYTESSSLVLQQYSPNSQHDEGLASDSGFALILQKFADDPRSVSATFMGIHIIPFSKLYIWTSSSLQSNDYEFRMLVHFECS